jgi:hypothetical protein
VVRSLFSRIQKLTIAQDAEYMKLTHELDNALQFFHGLDSQLFDLNKHKFPEKMVATYEKARGKALASQIP